MMLHLEFQRNDANGLLFSLFCFLFFEAVQRVTNLYFSSDFLVELTWMTIVAYISNLFWEDVHFIAQCSAHSLLKLLHFPLIGLCCWKRHSQSIKECGEGIFEKILGEMEIIP